MRRLASLAAIPPLLVAVAWASPAPGDAPLGPFLEQYCLACHTGAQAQAGLDLGGWVRGQELEAPIWRRVLDRVAGGEMPPPGAAAPEDDERTRMVAWLRQNVDLEAAPASPGRATLRRLNRDEYANAIRDLFGLAVGATELLPADDVGHGFDVIGDVLSLPPALLEKYLLLAERVAEEAAPEEEPEHPVLRRLDLSELDAQGGARQDRRGAWVMFSNAEVFARLDLPREGRYRVRARARAQQAGPELARLALRVDGRVAETYEVAAVAPETGTYEATLSIRGGARRIGAAFVNDYYAPDDPDPEQRDRNLILLGLDVEGPLDARPTRPAVFSWLPPLQEGADEEAHLARAISALARRAWRAPVATDEVRRLLAASSAAGGESASLPSRMRVAIQAILTSPRFLFRVEAAGAGDSSSYRPLADHELATRLAMFLWSSLPDERLLNLADEGRLGTEAVLEAEVQRMLEDARATALADRFAPQWLHIQDLAARTPDPDLFPGVNAALLVAMQRETILLFEAVLREDRDVRTLLDADFTFVNEELAELYGLPGIRGPHLRRVALPPALGGGVLTHASVLTATSNPTRTSPVKRGKWILEVLLDAPPPPPPPGVGALDESPEAAQAASLRERLAQHRADPSCAACHAQMDPLGLALERYDPIGRLRDVDEEGRRIDDQAELPGAGVLSGLPGLRAHLLEDPAFPRALAKHMLVYALGRGLTEADGPAVADLVLALEAEPTIRSLVQAIVRLDAFRTIAGDVEEAAR